MVMAEIELNLQITALKFAEGALVWRRQSNSLPPHGVVNLQS